MVSSKYASGGAIGLKEIAGFSCILSASSMPGVHSWSLLMRKFLGPQRCCIRSCVSPGELSHTGLLPGRLAQVLTCMRTRWSHPCMKTSMCHLICTGLRGWQTDLSGTGGHLHISVALQVGPVGRGFHGASCMLRHSRLLSGRTYCRKGFSVRR